MNPDSLWQSTEFRGLRGPCSTYAAQAEQFESSARHTGFWDSVSFYHGLAIRCCQELGDKKGELHVSNAWSRVTHLWYDFDAAVAEWRRAVRLSEELDPSRSQYGDYWELRWAFERIGQADSILTYHRRMREPSDGISASDCWTYIFEVPLLLALNRRSEAHAALDSAEQLVGDTDPDNVRNCHSTIAGHWLRLGEIERARPHVQALLDSDTSLADSLFSHLSQISFLMASDELQEAQQLLGDFDSIHVQDALNGAYFKGMAHLSWYDIYRQQGDSVSAKFQLDSAWSHLVGDRVDFSEWGSVVALARGYHECGYAEQAHDCFALGLDMALNSIFPLEYAMMLRETGIEYALTGDTTTAFQYFGQSRDVYKRCNSSCAVALIDESVANIRDGESTDSTWKNARLTWYWMP